MNNKYEFGNVEFGITLPPPLDKPLMIIEELNLSPVEVQLKINELIERQNTLIEIIKQMAMK
jgi:hypothetical protein